ncbi:ALQxL family class IV lanthipeptide [Streptomyces sp. NBC_01190]|nr:ALQxL family class IV lanthipeptide [Streptomyces sp. NBC_01190]
MTEIDFDALEMLPGEEEQTGGAVALPCTSTCSWTCSWTGAAN